MTMFDYSFQVVFVNEATVSFVWCRGLNRSPQTAAKIYGALPPPPPSILRAPRAAAENSSARRRHLCYCFINVKVARVGQVFTFNSAEVARALSPAESLDGREVDAHLRPCPSRSTWNRWHCSMSAWRILSSAKRAYQTSQSILRVTLWDYAKFVYRNIRPYVIVHI